MSPCPKAVFRGVSLLLMEPLASRRGFHGQEAPAMEDGSQRGQASLSRQGEPLIGGATAGRLVKPLNKAGGRFEIGEKMEGNQT